MAEIELDLQLASDDDEVPDPAKFELWVERTLSQANFKANDELPVELTIRVVEEPESQDLNNTYRQKNQPTNVLSFPFESPEEVPLQLLGDLVICAPIVRAEAQAQQKTLESHWAHMVIHGTLHLLGYDHIEEQDAETMETLETRIMGNLGYGDPYKTPICE